MGKDFAFLFKPGDYLRDTQCLSERVQVAYDRIMCEHMRNICITQSQLNFFTKRLTPDEKTELIQVLNEIPGGFEIEWVAESIRERIAYSESRRQNREGKTKKHMNNISKTYDKHMEGESDSDSISIDKGKLKFDFVLPEFKESFDTWIEYKKARKEMYKTQKSLEACFNNLLKLSNNDPGVAKEIVNSSLANNYAGLFPLKKDNKAFGIPDKVRDYTTPQKF